MMSTALPTAPNLFSYRKYWAQRFGVAPVLPMSRAEMDELGWDSCDVILVTGDAYIDHPSFGMALDWALAGSARLQSRHYFPAGLDQRPVILPSWAGPTCFLG
jgi:hypothetical protein